jgi:cytochrome c553
MRHAHVLLAVLTLAAAPAAWADPAAPEKAAVCAACHGSDGKATLPIYPHLAGQYSTYLQQALREYRSGARKNPVMGAQAATLTDKEIRQLAEYFSHLPGPLHTPDIHTGAKK